MPTPPSKIVLTIYLVVYISSSSLCVSRCTSFSYLLSLFPAVSSVVHSSAVKGNELHEAHHIDPLKANNEGSDPQAAPVVCSSTGVNGSNLTLINQTNSNWLLVAF